MTSDSIDTLTAALNDPAGVLAAAALEPVRFRAAERSSGEAVRIDGDVRPLLEKIVSASGQGGRYARCILASRLSLLHSLDKEWTEARVVPLLDWADAEEAGGAWQGFLWSPVLSPDLWVALRPSFVATFDHLEDLPETAHDTLFSLLAAIGVDGGDQIDPSEIQRCLRRAEDHGRAVAAGWILHRMRRTGEDDRDRLWREQLAPFFEQCWPAVPPENKSQSASRLAEIAVRTTDEFPNAVSVLKPFLMPAESGYGVMCELLSEPHHPRRFPADSLDLLVEITPASLDPSFKDLAAVLEEIVAADMSLRNDARYMTLMDVVVG